MAPQTAIGRGERFGTWRWRRYRSTIDILAIRGKMLQAGQKSKVASRLGGESLLLTTRSNLSQSVGNEGLVAREDGATLELVGSVKLGPLLA